MKGTNEVAAPFADSEGRLLVTELFPTLQGEGPDAGRPCVFIRLSRCNLRCFWCDTNFEDGVWGSAREFAASVFSKMPKHAKLVVITGGEPFLQNIVPFIKLVNDWGGSVSIETAGTRFIDGLDPLFAPDRSKFGNLIVCSPKTPQINQYLVPYIGAYKYIVANSDVDVHDGLPVMSTQKQGERARIYRPPEWNEAPIYVQPRDDDDPDENRLNLTAATNSALRHGHRLSIQMHKLAGIP
jgi:organic radical activating enzyme